MTNVPSVAVSVNLLESGLVSTAVINNSSGPLTLNIDSNNLINIIDSASNINNHFTELSNFFESSTNGNSNISLLGNIISSGGLLNISTNQLINSLDVVPYIANGYVVSDSNVNILSALDALNNAYLNSQLVSIRSTDLSTLNLNVSNFNLYSDSFLSILSNGYQVTDTASNITNLSELAILKAAYSLGNLKAISISSSSSSTTFTTANILNNASILSIINDGTYKVTITDSVRNVQSYLDKLLALPIPNVLSNIILTDSTTDIRLSITSTQLTNDAVVLGILTSKYNKQIYLSVSDATAANQAHISLAVAQALAVKNIKFAPAIANYIWIDISNCNDSTLMAQATTAAIALGVTHIDPPVNLDQVIVAGAEWMNISTVSEMHQSGFDYAYELIGNTNPATPTHLDQALAQEIPSLQTLGQLSTDEGSAVEALLQGKAHSSAYTDQQLAYDLSQALVHSGIANLTLDAGAIDMSDVLAANLTHAGILRGSTHSQVSITVNPNDDHIYTTLKEMADLHISHLNIGQITEAYVDLGLPNNDSLALANLKSILNELIPDSVHPMLQLNGQNNSHLTLLISNDVAAQIEQLGGISTEMIDQMTQLGINEIDILASAGDAMHHQILSQDAVVAQTPVPTIEIKTIGADTDATAFDHLTHHIG